MELCTLTGRRERCTHEQCGFWDDGGCAIERLGLDAQLDLHRRPDLQAFFQEIRRQLEALRES